MTTSKMSTPAEPVVLCLVSNERYFPGLYCTVMSALLEFSKDRRLELHIIEGGISPFSKKGSKTW